MAATISQQPNLLNGAYVPNVWVLDGLTTEDRYVLKVVVGTTILATIKQPANPEGVGIFDVQKILQSYLEPTFVEETIKATDTDGAHFSYQIQYGTETGTTEDIDGTSVTKYVINAYDNWRTLNMDLSDFIPVPLEIVCENTNVNARYPRQFNFLTNWPESTYKVRSDEYKTLSFLTRADVGGTAFGPNEAPFFVEIQSELQTVIYPLTDPNGSSLRTSCTDMTVEFTDDNQVTTIGVGPANLDSLFLLPMVDYTVKVYSYDNCQQAPISDCDDISELNDYLGEVIYQASFEIDDTCERFDPITVSFVNQYGVKDYYDFKKRNTSTTTTSRNNYTSTLGSWSSDTFTIDQQGRGKTTFSSNATTRMFLSTDWVEDNISEWLKELYISPSVMIYINGKWEPCTILTTDYQEKTYARNQLFQHEITVEFANNQKIQRG